MIGAFSLSFIIFHAFEISHSNAIMARSLDLEHLNDQCFILPNPLPSLPLPLPPSLPSLLPSPPSPPSLPPRFLRWLRLYSAYLAGTSHRAVHNPGVSGSPGSLRHVLRTQSEVQECGCEFSRVMIVSELTR